jgi:hypothetical protein
VEFVGGPKSGNHYRPQPPAIYGPQVRCNLKPDGSLHDGIGPVGSVAIYERRLVDGEQKYVFAALVDTGQSGAQATKLVPEDRLEEAIKGFYENPNYDIYTTKPTDRHQQMLVHVGHRRAYVDVGIAGVIRELFRLGLDTIGSCQEGAKGEPFEGQAYIGFCRERDARHFYNILAAGGIEATFKPKRLMITNRRSADSPPEDLIEVPSGNVMFPSYQIERITELLQSEDSDA